MAASSATPLAKLRALLDSFWICRVSVFSVLSGWFLLYGAPQAQSLFLDLHTPGVGLRHWGGFYLAVFVFWMLPTQLSARIMLHAGADRFEEGRTTLYTRLIAHLPWILALACLVGIAAGQYWAFDHIPDANDRDGRPLEEVAYTQLVFLCWITLGLICLWLLAWMVLPRLINRLTAKSGLLDIWLFRVIAMAMFGPRAMARDPSPAAVKSDANDDDRFSPEQLQTAWAAITLFAIWVVGLYFVLLSPLNTDPVLSRAPVLPVFLGAWIPVLTFFAYFAHRLRLPLLAAFVLVMTVLGNVLPNLHSMRLLTQGASLESRQPSLEEALGIWRKTNGCKEKPDASGPPCPVRPIIVAAEGGASRAAFFTASLLAHLEDLTDPTMPGNPPDAHLFSRQLFAISTVSGSSLGAAVFAALREDGWPRPKAERAENALWFRSGKAHGVSGLTPEALPTTSSRKDVVQQVLAGDFLSPAIATLSLDIWLPLHAMYQNQGDRTEFLEKSWEQRYADPSGRTRGVVRSNLERGLSSLVPEENVWRPLLVFNGTSVTTGRRIITSTLYPLFKSPDDRRLDESVFRDSYDTYDLMCRQRTKTLDGRCTCSPPGDKQGFQAPRFKGCDIRLSTAASNSARFPIVSSHGDIHGADGGVIDRVVDGAYFDYSGIISALELRLQIARLDDELKPFVLFLTNDPGFNAHACAEGRGARSRSLRTEQLDVLRRPAEPPTEIGQDLFGSLRYPLDTLVRAWVARTDQAMSQAVLLNRYENVRAGYQTAPPDFSELRRTFPADLNFDVISVGARCNKEKQVRPIPMNWWLAMPTQDYLDEEICADHNRDSIAGLLTQLGPLPRKPPQENTELTAQYQAQSSQRYDRERTRVDDRCPRQTRTRDRSRQTR
jgi:hypothetical protein